MRKLVELLRREGCSCIVAKGSDVRIFRQRGIADLLSLLKADPDFLAGSAIADKVVGKAAAAIMIVGGVKELHALTLSEQALKLFATSCVSVKYDKLVHHIENRTQSDWCPMEKRCFSCTTAEECLRLVES